MQNTAKILEGQSLFDWCLIHTGVVSTLFDVMTLNGLTSMTVTPGTDLIIPLVVKADVVAFFASKSIVSIPADILPSNLNEVTVQALNSLDEIIASGSYVFGSGVNPLLIPDTEIKLNDEAFLSIPSTHESNIELRDLDNNPIVPDSITGSVIKIETGISLPILPDGVYTPVNVVSGPYELEWIDAIDVTTSAGQIDKAGTPGWRSGAKVLLNHHGDFSIRFRITGEPGNTLAMFGITYYYNDLGGASYFENIAHSFFRQDGYAHVYSNNIGLFTYVGVDDSTEYDISRVSNQIIYNINGVPIKVSDTIQTGPVYIDSTLNTPDSRIFDITINI